jgi:hypothetical protein
MRVEKLITNSINHSFKGRIKSTSSDNKIYVNLYHPIKREVVLKLISDYEILYFHKKDRFKVQEINSHTYNGLYTVGRGRFLLVLKKEYNINELLNDDIISIINNGFKEKLKEIRIITSTVALEEASKKWDAATNGQIYRPTSYSFPISKIIEKPTMEKITEDLPF